MSTSAGSSWWPSLVVGPREGIVFGDGWAEERAETVSRNAINIDFARPQCYVPPSMRPPREVILFKRSDPPVKIFALRFSRRRRAARCAGDSSVGSAPPALAVDVSAILEICLK